MPDNLKQYLHEKPHPHNEQIKRIYYKKGY